EVKETDGGFVVLTRADVRQIRAGLSAAQPLAEDSPDRPEWVQGKLDRLAVEVHRQLAACVATGPAAPATGATAPAEAESPAAETAEPTESAAPAEPTESAAPAEPTEGAAPAEPTAPPAR